MSIDLTITKPATQENLEAFVATLTAQYEILFKTPEYQYSANHTTPAGLARKMTLGLDCGKASKEGEGIKRTCRALGIAHNYKSIRAYLQAK